MVKRLQRLPAMKTTQSPSSKAGAAKFAIAFSVKANQMLRMSVVVTLVATGCHTEAAPLVARRLPSSVCISISDHMKLSQRAKKRDGNLNEAVKVPPAR